MVSGRVMLGSCCDELALGKCVNVQLMMDWFVCSINGSIVVCSVGKCHEFEGWACSRLMLTELDVFV